MTLETWDAARAAQYLQCNEDTVRRMAAAGELPGRKVGRGWIFDPELLQKYVRGEWPTAPSAPSPPDLSWLYPAPVKRRKRKPLAPAVRAKRLAARKRCYRQRNPGLIASYAAKRKAAELRAMPAWVDPQAIARVYAQAAEETARTGIPHHVDHIVPLQARNVSGLHVPWNLRVISATENLQRPRDYRGELCF